MGVPDLWRAFEPVTWGQYEHPGGEAGVRRTAQIMYRLAVEGSRRFPVWRLTRSLIARSAPYADLEELEPLFEFVRDDVRYTRDPLGAETVQSPEFTMQARHGDCDDKATLLGAFCLSAGHPMRYVLAATNPGRPRVLSHVYVEADTRFGVVAMDPAVPWARLGWSPPATRKVRIP